MLKLVGTENGKILDEKVIINEESKLTSFAFKIMAIDLLLDIGIFCVLYSLVSLVKALKRNKITTCIF